MAILHYEQVIIDALLHCNSVVIIQSNLKSRCSLLLLYILFLFLDYHGCAILRMYIEIPCILFSKIYAIVRLWFLNEFFLKLIKILRYS